MEKERLTGGLTRCNRPSETDHADRGVSKDLLTATLPLFKKLSADARIWVIRGGFVERAPITREAAEKLCREDVIGEVTR